MQGITLSTFQLELDVQNQVLYTRAYQKHQHLTYIKQPSTSCKSDLLLYDLLLNITNLLSYLQQKITRFPCLKLLCNQEYICDGHGWWWWWWWETVTRHRVFFQ